MGIIAADTAVVFESSVCPEPEVSAFIVLSLLSVFTIFAHLLVLYVQLPAFNYPKLNGYLAKIIKSIFYLAIFTFMLVDACWLAHIYSWGIAGFLAAQTQGIIEWSFVRLYVAVTIAVLLVLAVLWLWTLWSIASKFLELWAYWHRSTDVLTQVPKSKIE
ncbi:hypothetical protein F5Y08DRAFT_324575 [Xylaria arbuscula]|nr:hypothetical protein F5Y08DRAFT_324575 [Xylaria arbuscula]